MGSCGLINVAGKSRCFGNIFRFIDGLNALNDCGESVRNFRIMYPYELDLRKEIFGYVAGPFLQLMITIKDKKNSIQNYLKRGIFFHFQRYTCLT